MHKTKEHTFNRTEQNNRSFLFFFFCEMLEEMRFSWYWIIFEKWFEWYFVVIFFFSSDVRLAYMKCEMWIRYSSIPSNNKKNSCVIVAWGRYNTIEMRMKKICYWREAAKNKSPTERKWTWIDSSKWKKSFSFDFSLGSAANGKKLWSNSGVLTSLYLYITCRWMLF